MCKEEGFCVAAGIPSTEKAMLIIDGLKATGTEHVAFKPRSTDGIRQVVNVTKAIPTSPASGSGVAVVLAGTTHAKTSMRQFWQHARRSGSG
jgi:enoyl reductase-like protein